MFSSLTRLETTGILLAVAAQLCLMIHLKDMETALKQAPRGRKRNKDEVPNYLDILFGSFFKVKISFDRL